MALGPRSEPREHSEPADYQEHHPEEDPRDWGWHGEWGQMGRGAGLVIAAIVLLMITATNYQLEYRIMLVCIAAFLVGVLMWDRHRRSHL